MIKRFSIAALALHELGINQIGLYALYQLGIKSGHYRRLTSHTPKPFDVPFKSLLRLPDPELLHQTLGDQGIGETLAEADEIVDGQVRLFGGDPLPINLVPDSPLQHWTVYEVSTLEEKDRDIKLTWEPARFGWVYGLGRAYLLTGDEKYPSAFWKFFNAFQDANPVFYGPNWVSAQEVALRLIAFSIARQVFENSPSSTELNRQNLDRSIAAHAERIPVTLVYARSQNNNHLLSEAAGLYTAGVCLPDHPQAAKWRALGWKWFNQGIRTQIDANGAYSQNSSNYHRLMLQLALWMDCLVKAQNQSLPVLTSSKLAQATHWLSSMVDPLSGGAPNLGPNDGAYIQPFTICSFTDYRPVLQAASMAFQGKRLYENGAWDEMSLWYGAEPSSPSQLDIHQNQTLSTPHILKSRDQQSWAYLRMAQFHGRPGHADQLQLDLWWKGFNLLCDAGTYQYNAAPPWDNALTKTVVHNTITVNGQDQMLRAGRFLYLRWAQAMQIDGEQNADGTWRRLTGQHNGYRSLGLFHQRSVTAVGDHSWYVEDFILPVNDNVIHAGNRFKIRQHWLLPDWPWELDGATLRIQSPAGWLSVAAQIRGADLIENQQISLACAGKNLAGSEPVDPTRGWYSRTYSQKLPALSFAISANISAPVVFAAYWDFPVE